MYRYSRCIDRLLWSDCLGYFTSSAKQSLLVLGHVQVEEEEEMSFKGISNMKWDGDYNSDF